MARKIIPLKYQASPFKRRGRVGKLLDQYEGEFEQQKTDLAGMRGEVGRNFYDDLANPYAGLTDHMASLENTAEDLTINQQQADYQTQQAQINQANTMQALQGAAGGSGIAGLAQQVMNQGQLAAQQTGATIGQQEAANQAKAAQGAASVQQQKAAGEQWSINKQQEAITGQLSSARADKAAADAARSQAATLAWQGASDVMGGVAGGITHMQEKKAGE